MKSCVPADRLVISARRGLGSERSSKWMVWFLTRTSLIETVQLPPCSPDTVEAELGEERDGSAVEFVLTGLKMLAKFSDLSGLIQTRSIPSAMVTDSIVTLRPRTSRSSP